MHRWDLQLKMYNDHLHHSSFTQLDDFQLQSRLFVLFRGWPLIILLGYLRCVCVAVPMVASAKI